MRLSLDRPDGAPRLAVVLGTVFAVAVLAFVVWSYLDFQHRVEEATAAARDSAGTGAPAGTPLGSSSASGSPATNGTNGTNRTNETDGTGGAVVSLWIGDGYTAGTGADSPQSGEACVAARLLHWTCELDAERGTGFLSNGHVFDAAYAAVPDRLPAGPPTSQPDVVVLDAGRNDLGVYAEPQIEKAMGAYVARLREVYPDATLVQVVPWTLGQDAPVPRLPMAIDTLMRRHHGYVVDPYAAGWAGAGKTDLASLRSSTGVANQTGHDLIGRHLADSIRDLGLPAATAG